jgi:hypothetical protein
MKFFNLQQFQKIQKLNSKTQTRQMKRSFHTFTVHMYKLIQIHLHV